MIKNNLCIAPHSKRIPLLLTQQHMNSIVFTFVFFISIEMKDFLNIHSLALINVERGHTPARRHTRNAFKLDSTQSFNRWRFYLFSVVGFEIVNVAELAWLGDTFAADEASVPVEAQ